jgi:hypothetical protein
MLGAEEQVVTRGIITFIVFHRLHVCIEGSHVSIQQMANIGMEFIEVLLWN